MNAVFAGMEVATASHNYSKLSLYDSSCRDNGAAKYFAFFEKG
jgi:hypothetical protein